MKHTANEIIKLSNGQEFIVKIALNVSVIPRPKLGYVKMPPAKVEKHDVSDGKQYDKNMMHPNIKLGCIHI